ncbi:MAG TPA: hypothetical protein VJB17_03965 [Patescibacteria group bacterium]|nr:hypothetical protein [Patescibacteria group bacterium]
MSNKNKKDSEEFTKEDAEEAKRRADLFKEMVKQRHKTPRGYQTGTRNFILPRRKTP